MLKTKQTVGVVVFQNDSVLIIKHLKKAGHLTGTFGLPAGRPNKNEILIKTAKRELKEETGLTTDIEELFEFPGNDYIGSIKRKDEENIIMPYKIFICLTFRGKLKSSKETLPEFIKITELKKYNLLPNVEKIIRDAYKYLKINGIL